MDLPALLPEELLLERPAADPVDSRGASADRPAPLVVPCAELLEGPLSESPLLVSDLLLGDDPKDAGGAPDVLPVGTPEPDSHAPPDILQASFGVVVESQ